MNKNAFKVNNKLIFAHLKISWKLILFFALFWLGLTILMFGCLFIKDNPHAVAPTIGKYYANEYTYSTDPYGHNGSSLINTMSISEYLNWNFFGFGGIIFFGIILIMLTNKYFTTEIKNKKMMLWLSLTSRNQIIYSKILFFITTIAIIFIPSFIVIIVFSAISYDAQQYFGWVILYGIEFFLFLILLVCVFTVINFSLIEKGLLPTIINSLIIFWICLCAMLIILGTQTPSLKNLQYMKYASPFSLVISPLQFSSNIVGNKVVWSEFIEPSTIKQVRYDIYENISISTVAVSITTIAMPIISVIISIIFEKIFIKKDLNV